MQKIAEISIQESWMDIKQAIQYTGLSDTKIRNGVYDGSLRASRTTGKLLFKRTWIDKWLIYGHQKLSNKQTEEFLKEILDEHFYNGLIRKMQKEIAEMPVFPIADTIDEILERQERIIKLVELRDIQRLKEEMNG